MKYSEPQVPALLLLCVTAVFGLGACGLIIDDDVEKYNDSHEGILTEGSDANKESNAGLSTDPTSIVPIDCKERMRDLPFASKVVQAMFNRPVNDEERQLAVKGNLDREKFVDDVLASAESAEGITIFITNLFRLQNITGDAITDDDEIAEGLQDNLLVEDLKKEPIELVLRNLDKPWPWFFTTRDIYCTKNTAKVYNWPELESSAFVRCQLPQDRAGFLGLASVLRAAPSSAIAVNNNYHRVAMAVRLMLGFRLFDATNGPQGEDGLGIPLPACVPTTDTRVDPDGLVYGTAAIPAVGPVCASCHSRYNGPLSVAFRRFNEKGETYSFEEIDGMNNNVFQTLNMTRDQAKVLINESQSCWSPDGISPPQVFSGVPGLGQIAANANILGEALSKQIPNDLLNVEPDPNSSSSIRKSYEDNGKTLKAAIKGFLTSDSFQCAVKGE